MNAALRIGLALGLAAALSGPASAQDFLWRASVQAPTVGSPVVGGDGNVYVACEDSRVRAYDRRGNPLWTFILKAETSGQMALQSGILYVPTRASAIEAVGTNGHRAWEYRVDAHVLGAPAVTSGGEIAFVTADRTLHCITADGTPRWEVLLPGTVTQGPAVGPDGTLVVGCEDALFAYSGGGGRLWKYTFLGNLALQPSVGPTGHILFLSGDGKLRCLYPEGTLAWLEEGKTSKFPPLVTAEWVYLATTSTVERLALDDGSLDWDQSLVASGCPALGEDDILYVPTKSGARSEREDRGRGEVSENAPIYTISGYVTGIGDVSITLSGPSTGTTTTDASNYYEFRGLDNGTYTVTPSKSGYTFVPASRSVTVDGFDQINQNFIGAVSATYAISGTITLEGSGLSGVTVATSGNKVVETTTNAEGEFILEGLTGGTYTVTPTLAGYHFTPSNRTVLIEGASEEGVDFEARTVSGNIRLLDTEDGTLLPTSLDILASGGDIALTRYGEENRLVVLNSVPTLFCYGVTGGPLADAWSQSGAGPRRQFRMDRPPEVTLLSPSEGEVLTGPITVEVDVEDSDPAGVTLRLFLDGSELTTIARPPWIFTWHTEGTPDGDVALTATATDLGGNSASDEIGVTVENGATPPMTFYADDPPQAFTWVAPAGETRFKVQCASDPSFQAKVASSAEEAGGWIGGSSWTPQKYSWKGVLSVGKGVTGDATGYWRVVGKNSGSFVTGTYVVKAQLSAQPTGPADGATVSSASPPTFAWSMNHNRKFLLEFSPEPSFATVVATSSTSESAWLKGASWSPSKKRWKKIQTAGSNVYWRVRAKDALGREAEPSPPRSFTVN